MARTKNERLAELLEKERRLKEQIARIESQQKAKDRKADTRRKILIGSAVLSKVKAGRWSEQQLRDLVDSELTADRDRVLFDLPPKEPSGSKTQDMKASDAK